MDIIGAVWNVIGWKLLIAFVILGAIVTAGMKRDK